MSQKVKRHFPSKHHKWHLYLLSTQPPEKRHLFRLAPHSAGAMDPIWQRLHKEDGHESTDCIQMVTHQPRAAWLIGQEARAPRKLQSGGHRLQTGPVATGWSPSQSSFKCWLFTALSLLCVPLSLPLHPPFCHSPGPSSWHRPGSCSPAEQPSLLHDSVTSPQMPPWNPANSYYIKAEWLTDKSSLPQNCQSILPNHGEREGETGRWSIFGHWEKQNGSI